MRKVRSLAGWGGLAALVVLLLLWWALHEPGTQAPTTGDPGGVEPALRTTERPVDAESPTTLREAATPDARKPPPSEAVVTGRVVDVELRPVAGGRVVVTAPNAHLTETVLLERTPVDETGRFRLFDDGVLRRVTLTYTGPGHFAAGDALDLYRGKVVELVAEALQTVRVQVVDAGGEPVANARVHGNRRRVLGDAGDALTDENGTCGLVVGPGAMSIMARAESGRYGFLTPVFVPRQDRVVVRLDRELADVPIRLVPAPGSEHLAGTSFTLIPSHGIVPIRRIAAVVGGEPVVVPLKHVNEPRPRRMRGRSGERGGRRVRYVGTLRIEIGDGAAYRVPVAWSRFERGREGEVLVLRVEDRAHRVTLHLRDAKGNPVRGYPFRLVRALSKADGEPAHLPLRRIEARSDHTGAAVFQCASGTYTGPFAGRLEVKGPLEKSVGVDVTTAFGTAEPGVGHVRVVPLGQESADWASFPKVPIEGGTWYVNLEGVAPGTPLVAQWMDTWAPLASAAVVAGGPPVHLEVEAVTRNPHRTALRVRDGGRLVWCQVKLDTQRARKPRIQRDFVGLRTFDLSAMPPGEYVAEVITRDQLVHLFDRPFHVGTGEVLELDVRDADRVWDGPRGGWLRK